MKRQLFLLLTAIILLTPIAAQERDLLDIDFGDLDSIFDLPEAEEETAETPVQAPPTILQSLRRRGLEFSASYTFEGATNPGWDMYPWEFNGKENFSWALGINMNSTFGIDAHISSNFRVRSSIRFNIPNTSINARTDPATSNNHSHRYTLYPELTLRDFYLDYNFNEVVFFRAGKFTQSWGFSPNFDFTNILKRNPEGGPSGSPFTFRFDIPINVGGIQLLVQTKADIAGGEIPDRYNVGFGGKYNLALQWADFNMGFYVQDAMATRGFFTIKTTIGDTEVYNEWLLSVNSHTDKSAGISFNLGFARAFFDDKLELNGELFYNMEGKSPYIDGLNLSLNLLYRFSGWGNPRFFTRFLYGDRSVSLIPGIRITPFTNMEIYFALPLAFGREDSYYYKDFRKQHVNKDGEFRPFNFLLYITFRGSVRASYFY